MIYMYRYVRDMQGAEPVCFLVLNKQTSGAEAPHLAGRLGTTDVVPFPTTAIPLSNVLAARARRSKLRLYRIGFFASLRLLTALTSVAIIVKKRWE